MFDLINNSLEKIEKIQAQFNDLTIKELEVNWKTLVNFSSDSQINILTVNPRESKFVRQVLLHYFLETSISSEEKLGYNLAEVYLNDLRKVIQHREFKKLNKIKENFYKIERIVQGVLKNDFKEIDKFIKQNEYFITHKKMIFQLNLLKFFSKLDNKMGAIEYLRQEMRYFIINEAFKEEMRKYLLFLLSNEKIDLRNELINTIRQECSIVLKIPLNSHMKILFETGKQCIPILEEASKSFCGISVEDLIDKECLVRLPTQKVFHSLFVCPVLKIASDDNNFPVLLECGHVICQNAIAQISKSGQKTYFKCPYCPMECTFGKSKMLFLRNK